MAKNNTAVATASGGSIGFCGLLTIAFIVLKLCKVIEWSWLWVLSPLWIPLAIGVAVVVVVLLVMLIAYLASN